jgi:four helix bundle protein
MALARALYVFSQSFPKEETFGLRAQLRRAAVSIPSNNAEGHGRTTDRSFRVFVGQARGSLCEVQTQVMLACDLGYVDVAVMTPLLNECEALARMMNALLQSLQETRKGKASSRAGGF